MKLRLYATILFCSAAMVTSAQEVQWAQSVISFTSQASDTRNSVQQVLGRPSKYPAHGETPTAWRGKNDGFSGGGEEKIRVSFKRPAFIQQVAIVETHNPGAVEQIILIDEKGTENRVYYGDVAATEASSRIMRSFFRKTTYKVSAVEIVLQCGKVRGFNEIDAIAISESKDPVEFAPNVAKGIEVVGKKENLGRNINSSYQEVFPIISPDGKTLFVDRKNSHQNYRAQPNISDNIWYSTLQADGLWGPLTNIGPQLNNGYNSFVASVTPDGNTLLIGGSFMDSKSGKSEFGVWTVNRAVNGWSAPERVRIDNFYNLNRFLEFTLAADGKTIILTVQRNDSHGARDMYVCLLKDDGTWTEPKNLGTDINTFAEEATPFLASDGKTLYFSSDGRSSYGSNDMYFSRRLDDTWTRWSEPQNLGPDINSPGWDAYYTLPASGDYAYFVSSGEGSVGGEDIYRIKLPAALKPDAVVLVSGKVIDKKTGKPLAANIRYEILPGGKEAGKARSNPSTGEYKITLPAGAMYGFRAEAQGYIAINENLDVTKQKEYTELNRDLKLVPIEKGQTIRLNNIFFETAKSELRPESFSELDRLIAVIRSNTEMQLLISGHTDNVGTDRSNKLLSETRAKAVKDYLVSKGIEAKRLKTAGFGSTNPISTNTTEGGRQENRRVEFTIE